MIFYLYGLLAPPLRGGSALRRENLIPPLPYILCFISWRPILDVVFGAVG
ncbi:hypothetical protein DJ60_4303 [Yersinia enterocolitica]|nr:hypothetical protein CH47_4240 [Yersinia enterocolitica]KGA79836.1 hypothetical protein DJ60_4303 [Yersinia enterocolitica]